MKQLAFVVVVVALAASAQRYVGSGFSRTVFAQQTGNDLFQQALSKERAEGRVDEALRIYERIAKEFAADRPLAAKALLQIGRAYERLGKPDAQTAYERLIREFADQRALAAEARARLAVLGGSSDKATGLATRAVWSGPDVETSGSPSPDGRFMSFTDWDTGDLAIKDLRTGASRRLTGKQSWFASPDFAERSIISPDGSQVAYAWSTRNGVYELRLIGRTGGRPRVLHHNDDVAYVEPFEWSPDGKQIVALFKRADKTHQLALVTIADGAVRVLKTLDWRAPWKMAFSPDGRYVAYDFPPSDEIPERDLFLLAVDGSREVALAAHPAQDTLLGWMPNSDRVLFASDRGGTNGIWTIRVVDGRAVGGAELIKPAVGRVRAIGFTRAGDYYYQLSTARPDVYVATFDAHAGALEEPPSLFKGRPEDAKQRAAWSPDGAHLAYLLAQTAQVRAAGANTLVVYTLATGQAQTIPLKMNYANGLEWRPDGRAIVVRGRDAKDRRGLFRVDLPTAAFEPIMYAPAARFAIAPDGSRLFYERSSADASVDGAIVMRDLRTGQEQEIYSCWSSCGLALSPDGRSLAVKANLRSGDGTVSKYPSVQLLSLSGGEPRTIATLDRPDSSEWRQMAWSPDGRHIFFTNGNAELWHIATDGGSPQPLARELPLINGISVHPDGRRIAISQGSGKAEIWVLEHILPSAKTTAARR